jgi:hypothetical protein
VKTALAEKLSAAKERIEERLNGECRGGYAKPMFAAANIRYEIAEKVRGVGVGGIGAIHALARQCGLVAAIDSRVQVLKIHLPYHESDHVLNLAYNALCDGVRLEDLELRRNDEVFLDALAQRGFPTRPRRATSAAAFASATSTLCRMPSMMPA